MQSTPEVSAKPKYGDAIELVRIAQRFPYGSSEYAKAIGELIVASQTKIRHFAYVFDKDRDADDIVQEVSLKIFEKLHQLQEPSFYSTWIYRITANECLSERRKRRSRPTCSIEDVSSSPHKADDMGSSTPDVIANFADPSSYDWEKRVVLGMYFVRLFEVLDEEEKIMLELHYLEGLSIEVMAELMGINESTFKSRMFRIMRRLEGRTEYLDQLPKGSGRRKLELLFSGKAAVR